MAIGDRIREARKAMKLGQIPLAESIGYSQPVISEWESGKTDPTLAALRLLANTLKRPLWWFLEEDPPEGQAEPEPVATEPATHGDIKRLEMKIDRALVLIEGVAEPPGERSRGPIPEYPTSGLLGDLGGMREGETTSGPSRPAAEPGAPGTGNAESSAV